MEDKTAADRHLFTATIARLGFITADGNGVRCERPNKYHAVGILAERPAVGIWHTASPAMWVGTAYFPANGCGTVVIEVFGELNLHHARRIAWEASKDASLPIIARLADTFLRDEQENVPHVSNVENW